MLRRSKLQLCLAVLEALVDFGPLRVSWLTLRARMNYGVLKGVLVDLVSAGLVERRRLGNGGLGFAVTGFGRSVLMRCRRLDCGFSSSVEDLVFEEIGFVLGN